MMASEELDPAQVQKQQMEAQNIHNLQGMEHSYNLFSDKEQSKLSVIELDSVIVKVLEPSVVVEKDSSEEMEPIITATKNQDVTDNNQDVTEWQAQDITEWQASAMILDMSKVEAQAALNQSMEISAINSNMHSCMSSQAHP